MIEKSMKVLEFNEVLNILSEYAVSDRTKKKLLALSPYLNEKEVIAKINDTSEGRLILEHIGTPPLPVMKDITFLLEQAQKGTMLLPEQLSQISLFINACKRMKAFLKRAQSLNTGIAGYEGSIQEFSSLSEQINNDIRNNRVDDNASKALRDIRRRKERFQNEIRSRLEALLRSRKEWFNDSYISSRNGHFVLPVKKEYKNMVNGSVMDISSSGSTYFIEPTASAKIREELSVLEIEESNEERKILYKLTALVSEHDFQFHLNIEALETLDFIFAKAKLSQDMKAVPAEIVLERRIEICEGRHPLLNPLECVPLNFTLGNGISGVVITGPNTGGKTVALKTIGLLQLMAQSGLHVPCEKASLCMNDMVLCDIGDGQSISENLSTFSSHITNIINILNYTDGDSLVLLDELGSGTDPAEGMGIAIAILEELRLKKCLFAATTHYPEVKDYANLTEGLLNARMAFDRESLRPLYRLELGEAGESCALYIAKRLGLPKHILERACHEAYSGDRTHTPPVIDVFLSKTIAEGAKEDPHPVISPQLIRNTAPKKINTRCQRFQTGDSVMIYPQKKIGIVFKTADEKGMICVQIQEKKAFINHKRLQLKVSADDMYPKNYDFSIIFDSVANRKARHKMEKGYQENLKIEYDDIDKLP